MVYVASWREYQEAAENLYVKSPSKTRYCVKWNKSEGKLVLKITDDTTCIKFKTYSSIFLNRFESLNLSLMEKMQNRRPDPPPPAALPQSLTSVESGQPRAASPVPVAQSGPVAAGVKKKKPKKKKQ